MSVINAESFQEGLPVELCPFQVGAYQVGVSDVYFQEIRPVSQIANEAPIELHISAANSLDYLCLASSELYVKLKVKKADGSEIGANSVDKVGPVNLLLHSLFSTVEITLQNKVTISCPNYPFRAMITTLLNYGEDAKDTQLSTQGFMKQDTDSPGEVDPNGSSSSLYELAKKIESSALLELQGPLRHDLCSLNRYLLNQVDVKVKLY